MKHKKLILLLTLTLFTSNTVSANAIDFIFGAGSFGRKKGTTADCGNIIQRYLENRRFFKDETWKNRVVQERNPDFLNDLDYMDENRYLNSTLGIVDTKFDKYFDTQIYYTATGKPKPDGTMPVVDPEAKALVVYLHGSGTKKASGVGFAGKMNALARMGYSSLSFDLPFHSLGSRNPALADAKNFADYMNGIINKYRVEGQKVILVGHSFGPDVIAEYITRYPKGADSAVLISPGGFDKVTQRWYEEKTSKMDFGDTESNDMGGRWAGMVTGEKIWDKPELRVDPTKANPDLDVYVISGDREEYIPGELDLAGKPTTKPRDYDVKGAFEKYFSRVDVTIEPGVGHYIFNHKDANGHDVVLRSVLRASGDSLANEKELKKVFTKRMEARPSYDLLALRYAKEPFFRTYIDRIAAQQSKSGIEIVRELKGADDKRSAQQLLTNYMTVERQRIEAMNINIKNTAQWAPDFYKANKEAIDEIGQKGVNETVIHGKYLAFLESQPREVVLQNTKIPESVFVTSEKNLGVVNKTATRAVPKEIKAGVMKDPELKTFIVRFDPTERSRIIDEIGSLKVENESISNQEIIESISKKFTPKQ